MAKLWQKNYSLDSLIEEFTVGNDYLLDGQLLVSDCIASSAHAVMLESIGILTKAECAALKKGLLEIIDKKLAGSFEIKVSDEDCHTAIENYLSDKTGEAGKKIHTGRSRNDQVLAASRLYMRTFLLEYLKDAVSFCRQLAFFAEKYEFVPMPGRTHMQTAMPSSIGLWAMGFAEETADYLRLLVSAYDIVNVSPLGSAASYGVPLPLDRELTAGLLGFDRVQNNVLYVNNSRGRFESLVLDIMDNITITLSKMAQDLILFSLPEFGYFRLPDSLCSGSSIMPQKKNPDGLELIRAKSASVSSCAFQIKSIVRSLPSGYNRDFQETKEPFLRGLRISGLCIKVMDLTVSSLEVNADRLMKAFTPDIYATDAALELVAGGMSFRDAYREVGLNIEKLSGRDPVETVKNRTYTGTSGKLGIPLFDKSLDGLEAEIKKRALKAESGIRALMGRDIDILF
jgi:argininosuccinate lyase